MPLYEYKCQSCDDSFEILVRSEMDEQCPACESRDIKKVFSTFATSGTSLSGHSHVHTPSCGCGNPQGGCSLN